MKSLKVFAFIFLLILPPAVSWGYWVWSPESGKFVNPEGAVQDTAEEQYNYAMQLYKEKDLNGAAKQIEDLLKKFPNSKVAADAEYRLGTIYEEQGEYIKAFGAYKVVVESYPQSERFNEVIEREYRIGNLFLAGKKAKLLGLEILPSYPRAVEIFKHIVQYAPYSDYGAEAQFRLGLTYKKQGNFDEAVQAFQTLVEQYPQSELVPEARYQLAESSYQRSAVQYRDERALDEASKQLDQFITKYGDTEATEKAVKLRQQVDEKNAEKNYRIGLYYEKTDYVKSALIYYSDVARRYPNTEWGKKAAEKMKSLESPAEFHSSEEKKIREQLNILEERLAALPESDKVGRGQIQREIERLKNREKMLDKGKAESLKRRAADIKRRERELKEKFKTLEKRRKLLQKNPSADLERALNRWFAALEEERAELEEEKRQLSDWTYEMGMRRGGILGFLPFLGEPATEVDKVRSVDAKKYVEISAAKRDLLSEKELLYKQHGEVLSMLKGPQLTGPEAAKLESGRKQLAGLQDENGQIRFDLEAKRSLYEKNYGMDWKDWLKLPAKIVLNPSMTAVSSVGVMNPFAGGDDDLKQMDVQPLLERQMHLKEKIAAQQSLVEALSQAFDTELARLEQQRLLKVLDSEEKKDPAELRKSIKTLEKDIRGRYEEIKDRHRHKKDLLNQLDQLFKDHEAKRGKMARATRTVTKPVTGFAYLAKAFFVGLPHYDKTLTEKATKMHGDPEEIERAKKLKEEIETESLMIEIRGREISDLQKDLEILKAKASLEGGYRFRAAMVQIPYDFIRQAVDSANRLVPKESREETLINLLEKESKNLEVAKQTLAMVDAVIQQKTGQPSSQAVSKVPAKDVLQAEIQALAGRLEENQKNYDALSQTLEEEQRLIAESRSKGGAETGAVQALSDKEKDKLSEELNGIEDQLRQLIRKEGELESEEETILGKRIRRIDEIMKKTLSKAVTEDLVTERERMQERVSQITLRRDFLTKELERFQASEAATAKS